MSTESPEKEALLSVPDEAVLKTLGSLAIPTQPTPDSAPQMSLITSLPREMYDAPTGLRKTTLAVTKIKGNFQKLTGLTADERDVHRAKLKEESIRVLFKSVGMLENSGVVNEPFSNLYREVENTLATVDRYQLLELAEVHEAHPVIQVLDTLRMTTIPEADVVSMKCISLLLIDRATLA